MICLISTIMFIMIITKQCLLTQLFVPLIPLLDSRFQVVVIPEQLHQASFLLYQSLDKLLCFLFVFLVDVSSKGGVPGLQGFVEIVVFNEEVKTFLRRPT